MIELVLFVLFIVFLIRVFGGIGFNPRFGSRRTYKMESRPPDYSEQNRAMTLVYDNIEKGLRVAPVNHKHCIDYVDQVAAVYHCSVCGKNIGLQEMKDFTNVCPGKGKEDV